MKYALALAAATALVLIPLAARAVWRHFKQTQSTFDRLVDEAAPPKLTLVPTLEFVPDGFTCLRCLENPALPERVVVRGVHPDRRPVAGRADRAEPPMSTAQRITDEAVESVAVALFGRQRIGEYPKRWTISVQYREDRLLPAVRDALEAALPPQPIDQAELADVLREAFTADPEGATWQQAAEAVADWLNGDLA